jgi:hypothetical protein
VEATPRYPSSISVNGPYVYITDGDIHRLRVFDVSDPTNIVKVGTLYGTETAAADVSGGFAYLADGLSGFRVIALSSN